MKARVSVSVRLRVEVRICEKSLEALDKIFERIKADSDLSSEAKERMALELNVALNSVRFCNLCNFCLSNLDIYLQYQCNASSDAVCVFLSILTFQKGLLLGCAVYTKCSAQGT